MPVLASGFDTGFLLLLQEGGPHDQEMNLQGLECACQGGYTVARSACHVSLSWREVMGCRDSVNTGH